MKHGPDRTALATEAFTTYRHLVPDAALREFISALSGVPQPARGPLTVQNALDYVYLLGHDTAGQTVVMPTPTVLAEVPIAMAIDAAHTWGRFSELCPAEAADLRAELAGAAVWASYEDYRDAYAEHGGPPPLDDEGWSCGSEDVDDDDVDEDEVEAPPPPEPEVRAHWEALDWTRQQRAPLDGEEVDMCILSQLGWDNCLTMFDPLVDMRYALPDRIAQLLLRSWYATAGDGPFWAFKDDVTEDIIRKAFARLGCLVVSDEKLMSGYWSGIGSEKEYAALAARYEGQDQTFRNLLAALPVVTVDETDPFLFDDLFEEEEEEDA